MKIFSILILPLVIMFQTDPSLAEAGHHTDETAKQTVPVEATKTNKYVCPMHVDVQSDQPGQCPKCGMDLKPVAQEEAPGEETHEGHAYEHHQ